MAPGEDHGVVDRNLVTSDIFFGLGAILLIVVALLSLNIKDILTSIDNRSAISAEELSATLMEYASLQGPVIYAVEAGVLLLEAGEEIEVPLNEVVPSEEVKLWLQRSNLLIVDPNGLEASFLLHSVASSLGMGSVRTMRLPNDCQSISIDADQLVCSK